MKHNLSCLFFSRDLLIKILHVNVESKIVAFITIESGNIIGDKKKIVSNQLDIAGIRYTGHQGRAELHL